MCSSDLVMEIFLQTRNPQAAANAAQAIADQVGLGRLGQ